jgi:hypothetical protein
MGAISNMTLSFAKNDVSVAFIMIMIYGILLI